MNDTSIKKALLDGNYVSIEDIKAAEQYAIDHEDSFIQYLISEELTSQNIIGQAIAESLGVPYSNLKDHSPSKEQVLAIWEEFAKKWRVVMYDYTNSEIVFATDHPEAPGLKQSLSDIYPGMKIKITFALSEDIDALFLNYEQALVTRFAKIIENKGRIAPEIVDQILEDALLLRASDIHFEPREFEAVIRFRIDGVLHEAGRIPKTHYDTVVNRIKIQSKLRIDEHFSTQDGAIRYIPQTGAGTSIDLRVSIVPTLDGEKVAIRLLSSYVHELTLSDIGLPEKLQNQIMISAKKPFGMILVTGPTGSGKTTTLYSLIKLLNNKETNITTIEDPVEYKIQGINQIQANGQTGFTFAKGLRAIARQDPDIILVGEIRDRETADIAVNAALTGHLLLSTFHANNAATAIPRFIDMGVEPFLLGSTLELIISQRLVRKVCSACKVSYVLKPAEMKLFNPEVKKYFGRTSITLYKGKGCNACSHTGFNGRIGVFEFIMTSSDLQDLISKNPSTRDIESLVSKDNFVTMFEDGIDKVKAGMTTLEELLRIVAP